jgi:hypothetical protein
MGRIFRKLRSLYRGDHVPEGGKRQVENADALTATGGRGMDPQGTGHQGAPTDWVKPDDGRPRN